MTSRFSEASLTQKKNDLEDAQNLCSRSLIAYLAGQLPPSTTSLIAAATPTLVVVTSEEELAQRPSGDALLLPWDQPYVSPGKYKESWLTDICKVPVIMDDLVLEDYQLYLMKVWGAAGFTLYPKMADLYKMQYFIEIGRDLGMEGGIVISDSDQLDYIDGVDAPFFLFEVIDSKVASWIRRRKPEKSQAFAFIDRVSDCSEHSINLFKGFVGSMASLTCFAEPLGDQIIE